MRSLTWVAVIAAGPWAGGYEFSVTCDPGALDFTVTGTHAPEAPDSPARWPALTIDKSMAFHEEY